MKKDSFALDLVEIIKGTKIVEGITVKGTTELAEVERKIVGYFNSDEYLIEQNIELGKNYNNLMNQIVGAEVD